MTETDSCSIVKDTIGKFKSYIELNDSSLADIFSSHIQNESNSIDVISLRKEMQLYIKEKTQDSEIAACFEPISEILWLYIPPIIFLFGTIGNILTFIVLCQRSMNKVSFYVYLATLAVVDEMILFCGLFKHWLDRLVGQRIEDMSPILCKLSQLIGNSTSYLSVWLIVTLTIERLVVIIWPLRASQIATPRRAKMLTAGLAFICFLIPAHFIYTVDIISTSSDKNTGICAFKSNLLNKIWVWVDASLYSYIPFTIISSINVAMRIKINEANKFRSAMISDGLRRAAPLNLAQNSASRVQSVPPLRGESTRQLTMILLTVSCAFLVTTTPIVIIKFLSLTVYSTRSEQERANFRLADTLSEFLMHVNHAMNFYLYCATGQKFRRQLCQLFHSCGKTRTRTSRSNIRLTSMNRNIEIHRDQLCPAEINKYEEESYTPDMPLCVTPKL